MANNQIKLILETELKNSGTDLKKLETAGAFSGDAGAKNLTKLHGILQRLEAVDLSKLSGKELTTFLNTMSKFRALLDTSARSLSSYTDDFKKQQKLIKVAQENKNSDYISFNINGTPSIKTHYGFWTEYVTLDTLKRIKSLTKDKIFHEHVTNYIYTNPHSFLMLIKN